MAGTDDLRSPWYPIRPSTRRGRRQGVNQGQQVTESGQSPNNNAAAVQAAMMAQSKNMLGNCPPSPAPGYNNYQPPQVQGRSQMYPYYPPAAKPPLSTPPLNDPMRTSMASNIPVHPDVMLKRLPFYDLMSDLLKPSTLLPNGSARLHEQSFVFHLTPVQANDIAMNRDIGPLSKNDYIVQVQMRFALLETSIEQDDFFPPGISVKVNGKVCPLPNPVPTNRPGVEPKRPSKPVNITPLIRISPTVSNHLLVQWAPEYGRGYVIALSLVRKLTSGQLLHRLKSLGVRHKDYTTGLIKEKLREDVDSEIATTSLRVSLLCPLGKMRMSIPCRPTTCTHLQCFDANLYLQMNERKPTWTCPVCDKPGLFDKLVIDGYFQDVLSSQSITPEANEIQLHQDGTWSISVEKKEENSDNDPPPVKNRGGPPAVTATVEITDDDVVPVVSDGEEKDKESEAPQPPAKVTTVDLTLSDDSDDDSPPDLGPPQKIPDAVKTAVPEVTSNTGSTPATPGYVSPNIITLDSPSPPSTPHNPSLAHSVSAYNASGLPPFFDLDSEGY